MAPRHIQKANMIMTTVSSCRPAIRTQAKGKDSPARILQPETYKIRLAEMWKGRGERYDETDTFHRALAEKLVTLAEASPGQQVLDIATGTGMVAIPLAKEVGQSSGKVVGIDISDSMISVAAQKVCDQGLDNLQFLTADAETVDFEPGSFDTITCSSGMLYLQEHEQALRRMLSWLKPSGRLCFNTPQEPCVPATLVFYDLILETCGLHLADAAAPLANASIIQSLCSKCGFDAVAVTSSQETIQFKGASAEQYADRIWKSLADNAIMTPLNDLVTEAELNAVYPRYIKKVSELASSWNVDGGIANPYTMLWVVARKAA